MFYSSAPLWDGSASDDATCLDEQLTQAASLAGTIMPHGADTLPVVTLTSKAGTFLTLDPMVQNSVDRTALIMPDLSLVYDQLRCLGRGWTRRRGF